MYVFGKYLHGIKYLVQEPEKNAEHYKIIGDDVNAVEGKLIVSDEKVYRII